MIGTFCGVAYGKNWFEPERNREFKTRPSAILNNNRIHDSDFGKSNRCSGE